MAIDYVKSAQGRWGELRVVYPRRNIWNDNPYYIIDAPWSTADQRKAAEAFRSGNPQVPVMFPESAFVAYQKYGLRNDIGQTCAYPSGEVINNLLAAWQRAR